MGRPRVGQSYECYKSARKQYRNACRLASNAALGKACTKTSQLLRCNRHRQFWNVINSATSYDKQRKCKVTLLDCLEHVYEDKCKMNSNTTETIKDNETMVSDKFERLRHIRFTSAMISEMEVMRYIRQLNPGKAAGADGLTTEHYVYAIESSVLLHISYMLSLCLQHGWVPETFLHGVLIPIYKTGKYSSKANSYRPVTLSVTLTKILEMYILETCSLGAEGAFDHIPHSVIFGKLDGMMPDHMWRLLYRWYDSMYVTVRLNGSLGRRLDVRRGVRQGSIISPWIFNCFYRDMVKTINDMECGLIIGNNRYNVICYADDLLLTSATSTGLQTLINSCQKYVEEHGLCFNPTKTNCTVIGKSPFTTEATFYISGVRLQNVKTFKYLGAELGNLSHSAQCETANPSNKRCLS